MSYYEPYNASEDRAYREWAYENGGDETPELDEEERRDYQTEALAIAKGESNLLAEKGHIIALAEYIDKVHADILYLEKQNRMLRDSHPAFAAAAPKKSAASEVAA